MKPTFNLQDLLKQGDDALEAASHLLIQEMAVINCDGVESLTPGQIDLLFAEIPETWDFLALSEFLETPSLSDSLSQQLAEWVSQRSVFAGENSAEPLSTVSAKGIDKILSFLPTFENRGARLYEVNTQQSLMEPCTYSSEVNALLQALHDEGFILHSFNWGIWLEEANQYVNEPSLVDAADLPTIQKLLTTHVRAERFNSGHLAQLIDNGHILKILRRLEVIRKNMEEIPFLRSSVGSALITATRGDITQQQVDAIVNTTNISFDIGGGVSEAIHAAAGPGLKEACRKLKGCAVGQAKLTQGYNLSAEWVIHTVGPVWQGGTQEEEELLAQCYYNSLMLAAQCPIQAIAFPSISTGFHDFPLERAAHIAVNTVYRFLQTNTSLEKVIFICHNTKVFDVYSKTIKELTAAYSSYSSGQD